MQVTLPLLQLQRLSCYYYNNLVYDGFLVLEYSCLAHWRFIVRSTIRTNGCCKLWLYCHTLVTVVLSGIANHRSMKSFGFLLYLVEFSCVHHGVAPPTNRHLRLFCSFRASLCSKVGLEPTPLWAMRYPRLYLLSYLEIFQGRWFHATYRELHQTDMSSNIYLVLQAVHQTPFNSGKIKSYRKHYHKGKNI